MNVLKAKICTALSYIFIAIFIFALALSVEKIPIGFGALMMIVSAVLSIVFAVLAKKTKSGKYANTGKTAKTKEDKVTISKEDMDRLKANNKKLETFTSMSFAEQFKTFLELLGIDFANYSNESFKAKDGKNLTLNDIDSSNINDLDWAKFLAEKHELILINSNQDTLDSLTEFETYKGGFLPKYLKANTSFKKLAYYKDDIKHNDFERFELAKDLKYFIRDVCGSICSSGSKLIPIYIETNNPDTFLFGIYDSIIRKGLDYDSTKSLRSLAEAIGLYVFPVNFAFPKTLRKSLSFDDCYGDGVLADKNFVSDSRNESIIAELADKKKAARAKELEKFLSTAGPEIKNNDDFVPISHGFKSDDEIECFIFGKKHKLRVSSINKDEGELLDDDEIAEVNWLVKSNVMDDKKLQFEVLEFINECYDQWREGASHKTNIAKEFDIKSIMIDIQKDDMGDTGEITKVIAFCGESDCDMEHGLSVSFANRKFAGVNSSMEFNYVKTENSFDYLKWKEENPLMGMVPKFANVLIKNGYTDERKVCFFNSLYFGDYGSVKEKLKDWVLPSKQSQENFKRHAVGVKKDKLLLIEYPHEKELKDCLDSCITINKDEIIDNFVLTQDYKIDERHTNHFLNLNFVLKDDRVLIFTSYADDPIMKFLIKEFGVSKES